MALEAGGKKISEAMRLREREEANRKLKRLAADQMLDRVQVRRKK